MKLDKKYLLAVVFFFFTLFIFLVNLKTSFTTDAIPNWLLVNNLRIGQGFELTNYKQELLLRGVLDVSTPTYEGKLVSRMPPMVAIVATPFFSFFDHGVRFFYGSINPGYISEYYQYIGKITASFFISLSGVIIFFLSLRILRRKILSLVIASAYVFGTPLFSIDGQALWQHPIGIFFISLSLLILYDILSKDNDLIKEKSFLLLGAFLGMAVGIRLNNIIPFGIIFLYFFIKRRRSSYFYLLGSSPVILFNSWYNLTYFHNIFSTGYGGAGRASSFMDASPMRAFIGMLFSCNFGLFVYYPVLILSVIGVIYFLVNRKNEEIRYFYYLCLVITIANVAFIAHYRWYTGGYSWPSRMLSETIPFIFIFFFSLFKFSQERKRIVTVAFIVLLACTFFLNLVAVYMNDYSWHNKFYTSTDGWIWNWKDNPIFYYLQKGDIYDTFFEKGLDGNLLIKTKKNNIYSGEFSVWTEPTDTINTCSIYDYLKTNISYKEIDTGYFHLTREILGENTVEYRGVAIKNSSDTVITFSKELGTVFHIIFYDDGKVLYDNLIDDVDHKKSIIINGKISAHDEIKIMIETIDGISFDSIGFCSFDDAKDWWFLRLDNQSV